MDEFIDAYIIIEPERFRKVLDSVERSMVEDPPDLRAYAAGLVQMIRMARLARRYWECV